MLLGGLLFSKILPPNSCPIPTLFLYCCRAQFPRILIQFLPHSHPIIAQLGEDWGDNWAEKRKTTETDTTYTTTTTTTTTTNTANKEGARAKGGAVKIGRGGY